MPAISPLEIVATTLTGTLSTAAQPNVTSLGTLTSLTSSGTITATSATQANIEAVKSGGSANTLRLFNDGTDSGLYDVTNTRYVLRHTIATGAVAFAAGITATTGGFTSSVNALLMRADCATVGDVVAGDITIKNGQGFRGQLAAGTTSGKLIGIDSSNRTVIDMRSLRVVLDNAATETTVGAAGAASALPANPVGYLMFVIGGSAMKVPYYNH